jgi:hypothetical protein
MSINNLKKLIPLEQSGSINDIITKNNAKISVNEGKNDYSIVEKPTISTVPGTFNICNLDIALTVPDLDIVEFQKSFVNINLEMDIIFDGGFPIIDTDGKPSWCPDSNQLLVNDFPAIWDNNPLLIDIAKHQYIFVGFKNATDCIGEIKIISEAQTIEDTTMTHYQICSFALNTVKPKMEKDNKRNVFTLWENVHKFNQSVCGTYISYYDLYKQKIAYTNKIHVRFPVTINFDDILHFLNFDEFPRFLFGNLSLRVNIVPQALVWCCVDPKESILQSQSNFFPTEGNNMALFIDAANKIAPHAIDEVYNKRFIQFGSQGRACTNVLAAVDIQGDVPYVKFASYGHKDITLRCESIDTMAVMSYIYGYGVNDTYKTNAINYYRENPWVVPAEHIKYQHFTNGPNSGGLYVTSTFNLTNSKAVAFLFPESITDMTVFKNPYLTNCSVQINNKYYAFNKVDTTSSEFLRLMLQAASLDTIFTCTESFENSYTQIEGFVYPVKGATYGDNTDFMFMVPLERGSATPFYFDGYKGTGGQDTVTISGTFITQINPLVTTASVAGSDYNKVNIDNYYVLNRFNKIPNNPNPDNTALTVPFMINSQAPYILIIVDSFWVFQVGKQPKYYCSGREWSDILQSDYNAKYQQLNTQIANLLRSAAP